MRRSMIRTSIDVSVQALTFRLQYLGYVEG